VAVELEPAKQIYVFATADGDDEKIIAPSESVLLRFTHPAQVHVFLLPADPGVRFKYAESPALKRRDLLI
jgi:hypothetical protein